MFLNYVKAGYTPLPIGYLTKYPQILVNGEWCNLKKWQEVKPTEKDCQEWESWFPFGCGVGIALGEPSGVIAIDIDVDNEFSEAVKNLCPVPLVRKFGSKGVTAFFKYNGEKNKKWKAKDNDKVYSVELLSTGNQTVIPPSFHPATQQPYTWINGVGLLDVNKNDMPCLPDDFYKKVEALTVKTIVPYTPPIRVSSDELKSTTEDARNAISFISADCAYEEWVEIGMALKEGFGLDGFSIWNDWSAKGFKYPKKGGGDLLKKFHSFKNSGITIATLFHKAQIGGYVKEYEYEAPIGARIPFIERLKLEASPDGAKERIVDGFPPHLCDDATGLVGLIQKWIQKSAMFPQPALALGASISAVGVLYAHKIEGETGSRTNMYCLGVAPSGSGKEHPRKCVETLMIGTGNKDLIGGDPASSTGLLKTLKDGKGKRIIQIDEFGRVLKGMNNKNASAHVSGLPTVLMKLFSSASGTYFGTEYANHDGKMERKDIENPCLCIHASTVPEHLFQAMTGTDAIDGFLSRLLIFENKGYPDFADKQCNAKVVPHEIKSFLEDFEENLPKPKGNLANLKPTPVMINFSDEAREMSQDFCRSMRKRAQEKQLEGDSTYAIWTRTFEHATKLALVGHENGIIDVKVMKWALEVATYCSQYICDQAVAHIADSDHEKNLKYILEIIKSHGVHGMTRSVLVKKTQRLNTRERNDIIGSLIESEQVVAEQTLGKTKPITKYFYKG